MNSTYRNAALGGAAVLALLFVASPGSAQKKKFDFAERQRAIKEQFAKSKGKINKLVHEPPMIEARASDLADDEPVIGVVLNKEARAYPLTMLFGGGGIFELLNDTCGGEPIAVSW